MAALAADHPRLHGHPSFDLPGFGESPLPRDALSISGYARAIDALCRELGAERVTLIGSSMGGLVGAELALSFPTRVDRLVLVSAAGLSIADMPRLPLVSFARLAALVGHRIVAFYERAVTRPRLRRTFLRLGVRYPERLSLPLTWELIQGFGRPGFLQAVQALTDYAIRDRLPRITVPTLILWGEDDRLVPATDAWRFQRLLGGPTRLVLFEDTGHSPMLERPSRFNEVLAAFVAGEPQPEAGVAGAHGEPPPERRTRR